jgi:hypothetical protein
MATHKVKYSDFDSSRIIFGKTDEANATGQDGKPIKYFRIPIQYLYEVISTTGVKTNVKGPLYIEGPKETSRGPQTKIYADKGNKEVHSVFTKYDLSNSDHMAFISRDDVNPGTIHKLCLKCCEEVFNRKGEVGVACRQLASMEDLLHYPVKWTLGSDGRPTGENPAAIWKLFRYGKEGYTRETDFILPINGGQKVSWEMISASRIEHQPVFKVDNITIAGGRPSIKMEMASSVIYDIISGGGPSLQADTVAEVAKDSFVTSKLLDKIKELEAAVASRDKIIGGSSSESTTVTVAVPAVIPGIALQGLPQIPEPVVSTPVPVVVPVPSIDPAPLPVPVIPAPAPVAAAVEPVTLTSLINSAPAIPAPVIPVSITATGGLVIPPLP